MKKSLFEMYSLVVCLVAIIVVISSFSGIVLNSMNLANVENSCSLYQAEKYLNNTNYTMNWKDEKLEKITDEKITELREQERSAYLENQKFDYKAKLVNSIIYLLSGIILFAFHWIFAKRERMKK